MLFQLAGFQLEVCRPHFCSSARPGSLQLLPRVGGSLRKLCFGVILSVNPSETLVRF